MAGLLKSEGHEKASDESPGGEVPADPASLFTASERNPGDERPDVPGVPASEGGGKGDADSRAGSHGESDIYRVDGGVLLEAGVASEAELAMPLPGPSTRDTSRAMAGTAGIEA